MQDDNFSLNGKSIVVTGAAQGIVRAIAQLALDLGATVTAVDLNAEALNAFADEAGHERLLPMSGSVADADFATQVVAQAAEKFGAVHGLVNNAGITRPAMIEKMSKESWQRVLDVHLSGSFFFLQPVGLAREHGRFRRGGNADDRNHPQRKIPRHLPGADSAGPSRARWRGPCVSCVRRRLLCDRPAPVGQRWLHHWDVSGP